MRQVFASARLENVEAVAALLREHGIEVIIRDGRGWRGAIRGNFSYRESARPRAVPTVWVVRSADQPQARQLLREAGLLDDERDRPSYLSPTVHGGSGAGGGKGAGGALRILLLAAVVLVGGFVWLRQQPASAPTAPPAEPPRPAAELIVSDTPAPYPAAMPTALAALLAGHAHDGQPACIRIDGSDADAEWLGSQPGAALHAWSDCPDGFLRIDIDRYITDGSGTGSARVRLLRPDGSSDTRHWQVQREGARWRLIGPATVEPADTDDTVNAANAIETD